MAEAIFQHLVNQSGFNHRFEIASAATSTWEIGEPVHPGTRLVLRNNDIPVSPQKRARQIAAADYQSYDYILAMDGENLRAMRREPNVQRLMDFGSKAYSRDVPDPYYTGDFDTVFDMLTNACQGLLTHIREEKNL
jgi:protein-tyrosine phosphatase